MTKSNFKAICAMVLIVLGIIAIVFGKSCDYYGSNERDQSYGGDAYTGIQQAAAQTANNVNSLGDTILEAYEKIMTFTGITMIAAGALTLISNTLKETTV